MTETSGGRRERREKVERERTVNIEKEKASEKRKRGQRRVMLVFILGIN